MSGVIAVVQFALLPFAIGIRRKLSNAYVTRRYRTVSTKKLTAAFCPAVRVTLIAIAAAAITSAAAEAASAA